MTPEVLSQIRNMGILLVLGAALLLLVVNMVLIRLLPRSVFPLMLLVWVAGTAGFIMVLIVDHSSLNILLAALFIISIGFHGRRIIARARRSREPQIDDDAENP